MISKGFGEIFEGDFADMCTEKFPLMLMRGRAEGVPRADRARTPMARTEIGPSEVRAINLGRALFLVINLLLIPSPIGASRNFPLIYQKCNFPIGNKRSISLSPLWDTW